MITTADDYHFKFVSSTHKEWDAYVRQHPKGSIFHTTAMIGVLAATRGVEPYAYAATDSDGKIVALLVSCHVKTLNQFAAVSSRVVQFAEPLCDPDPAGVAALTELIELNDKHLRSRALLCEVRSICEPGIERDALLRCGYQHHDYINYVVNLDKGLKLLWKSVHKRLRQKIRGTFRKGVTVRDDNTPEGIARLYKLLQASYGRAQVPLLDRELFDNTLEQLPAECVRVRTAFKDDQPVASIISLLFGDRIFSWYGGTLRLHGLSPFACIVWDDIVWGCENGYSIYDFGGAGWPHEDYGPRKFKAGFGGTEVHYGRYRLTYSKLRLGLAEVAYRLSRRLGAWS